MSKKKPKNSDKIKDTDNSKPDVEENQKTTFLDKVKKWAPVLGIIASILVIISFTVSLLFVPAYITPYVISSETTREYTPEDYLMVPSLETPNYILKTTKIIIIKPTSLPSNLLNSKQFLLPKDSFGVKVDSNDKYSYEINNENKKIHFSFFESRSSVDNIEISYSFKQLKNPKIILLDFKGIINGSTMEENLILENTENAKITSFRGNWIINDDEKYWLIEDLKNDPDFILVDNNKMIPDFNRTTLNETKVLIYSWDMDFEENEIKQVKILTKSNVNYIDAGLVQGKKRKEPAFEIEFPYKEDNFKWLTPMYYIENFPYPNGTGYVNGSGIWMYPRPVNTSFYNKVMKDAEANGELLR